MADPPIRDAATLVVVDRTGAEPRFLLGRRRPTQVFLPNVFVFPGGRVDEDDAAAPSLDELPEAEAALLAIPREGHDRYSPAFVRGLPRAALRETFEETGLAAGGLGGVETAVPGSWQTYLATGVVPRLSRPQFFLRAITPTKRPRRYDTRFFLLDAADIAHRGAAIDDELSELGWFDFRSLETLDVPPITRVVIKELKAVVADGLAPAETRRVPFFYEHNGIIEQNGFYEHNSVMHRAELSLAAARS